MRNIEERAYIEDVKIIMENNKIEELKYINQRNMLSITNVLHKYFTNDNQHDSKYHNVLDRLPKKNNKQNEIIEKSNFTMKQNTAELTFTNQSTITSRSMKCH